MKQKRYLHKRSIDKLPEFSEIKRFEKDFEDLKELCSLINKKSDKSAQALKNYIIIRLVGIVENELKAAAAWIIDEFKLRPRDLLDGDEITVSLTRLEEITGKNVTKGKIVITEYQMTNAKQIGELFSYINGVNTVNPRNKKRKRFSYKAPADPFFDWIQDLMQIPKSKADMYGFLDVILKERNEIVHYLKPVEHSPDELRKKIAYVQSFIHLFFTATYTHLSLDDKKSQKQLEYTSTHRFNMPLKKFKEITEKHKIT